MLMRMRQKSCEVIVDPDLPGGSETHDGLTCGHCGENKRVKPQRVHGNVVSGDLYTEDVNGKVALAARCTCCDQLICWQCIGKGCVPLQRKIEMMERRKEYERYSDDVVGPWSAILRGNDEAAS